MIINPKLSFQIYLQPFFASGNFNNFKFLVQPKAYDYLQYGQNGSTINYTTSESGEIIEYELDPDGAGPAPPANIDNPDFNYISLRGNAVLRWEYLPGSTIFLVWTQNREGDLTGSEFQFGKSFNRLLQITPENIFILKVTYWL